ncbi:uncharacterized protein LOC128329488 [Hemicordylus capensis]|uniref:uncharacterized protein LOC128329488 n=1 Tax=Hemicordylus capensis TaxID=884348 RepID=UPI002302BEAA|nr:uncharacterized protein LOC128329488 [Hemicordylus capensis]
MSTEDLPEGERWLQQFFTAKVFLPGDKNWRVGKNFFVVKSTVGKLVKWAYESSTGLYPKDPILVGSYREGLHLQTEESSNNFDFLIPVRFNPKLALISGGIAKDSSSYEHKLPTFIFRDKGVPVSRSGTRVLVDLEAMGETYLEVHCHKQEDEDTEEEEFEECKESLSHHNLDPIQILRDFHQYVEMALDPAYTHPRQNDPVFQQRLFPSKVPKIDDRTRQNTRLEALDLDGPAIQLTFDEGIETVPVNLMPAIQGAIKLSSQWLREDLTHLSDWWDGDLTNEKKSFLQKGAAVREVGPELVPKGGFWRLSFSHAETVILEDIDADGGQRKAALRLLKFVNKTRWVPEYGKVLTSYHLKTILLWCCEIYPQKTQWQTLLSSLQALLRILSHTLCKRNLPHYFLRPINLFSKRYKSSNTTYGPLALEALRYEGEVMLADVVGYLMPDRKPQDRCVHEESEEKMAALREFKKKHQEDLKELKRMEDEQMYEYMEMGEE